MTGRRVLALAPGRQTTHRAGRQADRRARTFAISSSLDAPASLVWRDATDLARVNHELRPWLRMTSPPDWDTLSVDRVEPGRRLFRSWLLLGGLVPVDYDDLTIVELEPGRRFLERSQMLSAPVWEHERVVEPLPGSASCLTDRIRFTARSGLHAAVLALAVPWVFGHRHRRLRKRYGGSR